MIQYLELCKEILMHGEPRNDRTGTGTLAIFDKQLKFDMQDGFPLVTTKRVNFKLIATELLWMTKGRSDLRYLLKNKNNIWNNWQFEKWVKSDEYDGRPVDTSDVASNDYKFEMNRFKQLILGNDRFAEKYGDLGPVYGVQWRHWRNDTHLDRPERVDQLQDAIDKIKNNPTDRRILVSAWNPTDVPDMALPPCHYAFQFYVRRGKYLDLKFHQRSADVFLGLPFDIASYATLLHMVAHLTGLVPGKLTADLGDTHIYQNHIIQVNKMLERRTKPLPSFRIVGDVESIDDFEMENFSLENYDSHGVLHGSVSV